MVSSPDTKPAEKLEMLSDTPIDGYTAEEDRVVTRKLDQRIMPIIFVLYVLAFLDRSNIGNAYTAGMGQEYHISSSQYQWVLTIYYISYMVKVSLTRAHLTKINQPTVVPPNIIASSAAFAWGAVSMLQATTTSWSSLMATRFFLAFFEASFAPCVILYISYYYPKHQFGLRLGIYVSGAALGSSFAGALAYALVHAKASSVSTWRLLFIVEGAPTVLFAPIVYFFLPNSIEDCAFLTEREKEVARLRMRESTTNAGTKSIGATKIDWNDIVLSLRDPINYLSAALFFVANVTFASLPVYLPTILSQAGFGSIRAQGFSAPPYLAAFISAITITFISDGLRHRGLFVAVFSVVGGTGYLVLATRLNHWVRYGATFLVAIGCFTVPTSWLSNNQIRDSRRGGSFALFAVIGQCGPILGTHLYPSNEGPRYVKGMYIGAGLLFFNVITATALSLYFAHLNARMDNAQFGGSRLFSFCARLQRVGTPHSVLTDKVESGGRDDADDSGMASVFRYTT
ncbi:MFS general substrate transporter [Clavulina sp. PMI_390]|nr:MFS general substrate transporter [Clavulina sp. PMI_390]